MLGNIEGFLGASASSPARLSALPTSSTSFGGMDRFCAEPFDEWAVFRPFECVDDDVPASFAGEGRRLAASSGRDGGFR